MTTADWAIIISGISLFVAILSFIWNVWSKFIYPKPRVRTSISLMKVHWPIRGPGPRAISLSATNLGPAEITLHSAVAKASGSLFKPVREYALLNPLEDFPDKLDHSVGPFSGGLPRKLHVGEQFSVYFPVIKAWFEDENLIDFGFTDTFGRYHWCLRKNGMRLREQVIKLNEST